MIFSFSPVFLIRPRRSLWGDFTYARYVMVIRIFSWHWIRLSLHSGSTNSTKFQDLNTWCDPRTFTLSLGQPQQNENLIKTKQNGFNDVTLTNCLVTSAGYHLKKTNTPRKRPWLNFNLGDFCRNEATLLYINAFPVGLSVDLPLAFRPTSYLAGRLAVWTFSNILEFAMLVQCTCNALETLLQCFWIDLQHITKIL